MAKKKQSKILKAKKRYRRNKDGRLDMRSGGRVSKFSGGPGNINVPNIDVQLTPKQIEAMRKANEATTDQMNTLTTPTTGPETVKSMPTVKPPTKMEQTEGVKHPIDTAPAPAPTAPPTASSKPPQNPEIGDTYTDQNGTVWVYTEKGWLDIQNTPIPPPPPP